MTSLSGLMGRNHTDCDDAFAAAEAAAMAGDWSACRTAMSRFERMLLAHFLAEEELLFPAFEAATGMASGPTVVMRQEHQQMRDLCADMSAAAQACDPSTLAGAADTLLVLMQQHNMKEENILYPMCDQAVGSERGLASALADRLEGANHV
ncbi:MAG: hemerythrin domain-containing protein [Rhodocyclaceae bacterium]|nr:hemerythrin domain-containing protein [Rhodocyclaceae bacterium]